ncbi:DUF4129 domain-containing protein [Actinomadura sp. 3N508]|uniref:DUF4129 domain-containing protein n=1 Tax=Actinomadura sp. 3N508 TaxID=3375153 RepID=UPI0037908422
MPPIGTPTRRELGRAGAAALLLAAGAYGVRGLAALWPGLSTHEPSTPWLIVFAVLMAAAAALVAAALRGRRDDPVFGRWTRPLAGGFVLLVLGLPLWLLYVAFREPLRVRIPWKPEPETKWPDLESEAPVLIPSPVVAIILALALITLGAATAWVVIRYRHRPWRGHPLVRLLFGGRRGPFAVPAEPPPPADRFEEAAAAGSRALRSTDDARAAVIACYTAMEGILAAAGAAPLDSDTPAEVLARASGAGIAGLGAATTLTTLFREARYSVHPVTERHRAEALAALESLRARSPA